ncbi:MAG: aminoglycoside phosphotransferase family protein [Rickettsiales bacterium]|nr:aminoglycoside phosphotransferase family protein [Rickettsiales bacterium]
MIHILNRLKKFLVNLCCCLIPSKKLRGDFRRKMAYGRDEGNLALIRRHFPDIEIKSWRKLSGACNVILIINEELVFPFSQSFACPLKVTGTKEICDFLQPMLEIEIPRIEIARGRFYCLSRYKFIKGMEYGNLPPEKRKIAMAHLAPNLAKFLASLHGCSIPALKASLSGSQKTVRRKLSTRKKGDRPFGKFFPALFGGQLETWIEYARNLRRLKSRERSLHPALAHNDFHPWNIIMDESSLELRGIIDFDNIAISSREEDFGRMAAHLVKLDPDSATGFMRRMMDEYEKGVCTYPPPGIFLDRECIALIARHVVLHNALRQRNAGLDIRGIFERIDRMMEDIGLPLQKAA